MKKIFIIFLVFLQISGFSQIGFGTVGGIDVYQRYVNPEDDIAYPAAGNAMLNLIYGKKMWMGWENISLSLEAQVNFGVTSFAVKDFKGMGSVAFPLIAKINYSGLSGFLPGFAKGISLGGGIQYTKTELIFSGSYRDKGVSRGFYKNYVLELNYGVGSFGSSGYLYIRYGINKNKSSSVLNIGILYNVNKTYVKKHIDYTKPKRKK